MIFAYLATGYTRIGKDSYFYFNPDGEPGGTLGQLMTGSIKVEDKLYFFDRESGLRVSTPGWYDVNGDGSVSISDAVRLQQYLIRRSALTADQAVRADLNGDGAVNAFDLVLLRRLLAK